MKKTLIGLTALAGIAAATPAAAQWHEGWRHHNGWHRPGVSIHVGNAYARDCAVRVSKTYRANGTVVTRRVRRCD
jgi:hypothetical protein